MLLKVPRVIVILVRQAPRWTRSSGSFCPSASPGHPHGLRQFPFHGHQPAAEGPGKKGIHLLGVGISAATWAHARAPASCPAAPGSVHLGEKHLRGHRRRRSRRALRHVPRARIVGHFVKMVHNGIEYAMMELIAEAYDLMKRGLGLTDDELSDVFEKWDGQTFHAYLMEITASSSAMSTRKPANV